jgi:protein SCO1/2
LLTVTIDPEHDTVPVLKDFSTHFDAIKGGDWNFATGTPKQVHDFASNMGLDYWPDSGQIVHSVVVYLIAKDGKIAKIWYGNDWKTQEALDAIKQLA